MLGRYESNIENVEEAMELREQGFEQSKERWVALGLFCALNCTQCCVWNTWGPIANSAMRAFPTWHKYLVALLSNWGCITYLTCCFPCCWLIYNKGLLIPLRIAALLSTIATFVRCLSSKEEIFTVMVHIAAILNGLSGVIVGPMTAFLSAIWFPRGERTTATGISSACNQLGMAISYLIGLAVVKTPLTNNDKHNFAKNMNVYEKRISREDNDFDSVRELHPPPNVIIGNNSFDRMALRIQIMSLMRIEFVTQFLVFLGILCFFPKEGYHQNKLSETPSRLGLLESVAYLIKNKSMWQLSLAAAMSQGVIGPWLAMITITFGTTITQEEADKLAFWTIVFSSVLSLVASRVMDIFQGHLKVAIYILLMTSSSMFLWVLLLDNRVLVFHKGELYVAVILGISASWSTPALFLELASEIAFPVSEAIVGGYMIFLSNLIGTLFYFSYFVSGIGEHWSSYCVFGNLILATILVLYVNEEYNRTEVESQMESEVQCSERKTWSRRSQNERNFDT